MTEIDRLISAVQNGSPKAAEQLGLLDTEVRGGLGAHRGRVADALIEALEHPNGSLRFEAAWALTSFSEFASRAAEPLVKLLNDPDAAVKRQAAETLGRLGVPAMYLPDLVDALGADDPVIRAGAADALAHLGPEARDAVPALTAALADSDSSVRISAATTLAEIGPDAVAAMPSLFRLVISEDPEAQADVVDAVVAICQNNAPAVQLLRELLDASGDQVRGSAATALRRVAEFT